MSFPQIQDPSLTLRMSLSLREVQLVKPLRIAKQNRFFVVVGQLGVFAQLFQLMFACLGVDFVGVVGGENERFVAGETYRLGNGQLFALAADKNTPFINVSKNVVDDLF